MGDSTSKLLEILEGASIDAISCDDGEEDVPGELIKEFLTILVKLGSVPPPRFSSGKEPAQEVGPFGDDAPEWLDEHYHTYIGEAIFFDTFPRMLRQELNDSVLEAMVEYEEIAMRIYKAGDVARDCMEMLLDRAMWDIRQAIEKQYPSWMRAVADREAGLPKHNALHNQAKNWTRHIADHPEWKERSENGKRWKVSNADVEKELTRIDKDIKPPSTATINRYRNDNFK